MFDGSRITSYHLKRPVVFRHSNELCERTCPHLGHHLSAVNFYRDLAGSKFVGGLLVEHAGYDHSHDFALSASQGSISLLQGGAISLF